MYTRLFFSVFIATLLFAAHGFTAEEQFDSEKMLSELESQLELNSEKLSKLKPTIDTKSEEMKKSIHEMVDKGFVQLEEMTVELDKMSKETEAKVRSFLNSEEVKKLKDYLNKLDKEAINEAKNKLVAELSEVLELTEQQLNKLKPILEDSMEQLSKMIEKLAKEGSRNWDEFKRQYEEISNELKDQMQETLDSSQMKKLEKYNEEKRDKIREFLFV